MNDLHVLAQHGITIWNDTKIRAFRTCLLDWYDTNKRDLPWRHTKDPYAIWVSEIMLQQTQVVTVIPYYTKFMQTLPTIKHLANADEQLLLKLWQGLGYYSRVRNMQIAAQQIMSEHAGYMPKNLTAIQKLKGIGPYTAGAIASIAFDIPAPAVDGNVMRVMSRLFEIDLDIALPTSRKVFEALIRVLIDPKRPGDFNQALMDLGSDICSAVNPRPQDSPIKAFNAAYLNGTMDRYPIKSKKIKAKSVYYHAYVIQNDTGDILLQQRTNDTLLANMWLFPLVSVAKDEKDPEHATYLGDVTHLFTHLKWHIKVFQLSQLPAHITGSWIKMEQLKHLPLPTPQLKMFSLLNKQRG